MAGRVAGDEARGVCILDIEAGLDTGAVYRRAEVAIGVDETADELRVRLVDVGTALVLDLLEHGIGTPTPQEGEPVYAAKIEPAELEIDWTRPAVDVHRLVRVGGAWTTHHGRRLKVWRTRLPAADGVVVATGTDPIELVEVQPEGKARMPARAWANGVHWRDGDRFE